MSINKLLAQHQMAQLRAHEAVSPQDRAQFTDLEMAYAAQIDAWRADRGLSTEGWPGDHSTRS